LVLAAPRFGAAAATKGEPLLRMQTVALNKQHVPVVRKGKTVAHKTAYFGKIFVGLPVPQPFHVLFDTGSGHVVLPSQRCESTVCKKHSRYQQGQSLSFKEVEDDHKQIDLEYGTGKISGDLVHDIVCLRHKSGNESADDCPRLRIVMASSLTSEPFDHFFFDGVIGLGLESLARHRDSNFFGGLVGTGQLPEATFSIFLSRSSEPWRSEVTFGGHSEEHAASKFEWAPVVAPEAGYWQVALKAVRVGDEELSLCANRGCRAVLDTGTSMLGVPGDALSTLHRLLARVAQPEADCRLVAGPPIVFDFGDFELRLEAEDYSRPAPMAFRSKSTGELTSVCRSSLMPMPSGVIEAESSKEMPAHLFVFGEAFLQKHYTKYDFQGHRIGFATARQPLDRSQSEEVTVV